jgi:hypothetical protein
MRFRNVVSATGRLLGFAQCDINQQIAEGVKATIALVNFLPYFIA